MLEKLAEIVREEAERTGATEEFPACMACDFAPKNSRVCKNRWCVNPSWDDGSLSLARWAVLLVAKGLEGRLAAYKEAKDECRKIHTDDDSDEEWCAEQWFHRRAFQVSEAIRDLIAEAREDASDER